MCALVPVSASSKKFDEISGLVRLSYPNSCIVWIDEIHNAKLAHAYNDRMSDVKTKRGETGVSEEVAFTYRPSIKCSRHNQEKTNKIQYQETYLYIVP